MGLKEEKGLKLTIKAMMVTLGLLLFLTAPLKSFADAAPGDVIITLGQDLTSSQKQQVLNDLDAPSNAQTVTVTNQEEHEYLGDFIPKATIGSRAISSSSITLGSKDSGLSVSTQNINGITDDMYINALMTAGVKDAKIQITAPFEVSGTAALTGIMKAYEVQTDQKIPEEVKKQPMKRWSRPLSLVKKSVKKKQRSLWQRLKKKLPKKILKQRTIYAR